MAAATFIDPNDRATGGQTRYKVQARADARAVCPVAYVLSDSELDARVLYQAAHPEALELMVTILSD